MASWPLPGGAVPDPASEQNFTSLANKGGTLEEEVRIIETEGLPPTGKVGGVLKGELPNPEFAVDMATQAELNAAMPWVSVATYGAKGDGLADDSAAIQAAIDTLKTTGGTVIFGTGTFLVKTTLKLYDHVHLLGAGVFATVLKLANEANTDLLTVNNYGANGAAAFSIQRLSVNGNQAKNTKGNGLKLDGLTFLLRDLLVHDFAEAGITSKQSSVEEGSAFGYMDSWVENVKSYLNAKGGILWEGPHDAHFTNVQAISNHTDNFAITGEAAATKLYGCHAYGDAEYGFKLEATCKAVNCEAEGASKAQVALFTDNIQWLGGTVFQDTTSATDGEIGFQFGRSTAPEKTAFNTQILGTRVNECDKGAFNLVNGFSGSRIQSYVYGTKGKAFVGTAPTQGQLDCWLHLQGGVELGIAAPGKIVGDGTGKEALAFWLSGEGHPRLILTADGRLQFGPGSTNPDVTFERRGVNELETAGKLWAGEFKPQVERKVKGSKGPAGGSLNEALIALNEIGLVKNETSSATITVASGNTISLGETCPSLIEITGKTEIKKVTATNTGHVVVLKFAEALTVKNGENLKLGGDYVAAANSSLILVCDGTNWYSDFRLAEAIKSGSAAGGDLTGTFPSPTIGEGKVTSAKILDKTIVNADISDTAAVEYKKLSLAEKILNSDIAAAAGIVYSKLSLAASIAAGDLSTGAKELFPQWPAAANRKVNRGSKTEVAAESDIEVEHGLGAEPAQIGLTLRVNENLEAAKGTAPYVKTASSTKITIRNPSNKKVTVYWWATS
jgi:pectate lyase-like protein